MLDLPKIILLHFAPVTLLSRRLAMLVTWLLNRNVYAINLSFCGCGGMQRKRAGASRSKTQLTKARTISSMSPRLPPFWRVCQRSNSARQPFGHQQLAIS